MREFRREAVFDLALSLFTSFGYFAAREDDLTVLQNVRAGLRPGGAFLIDVVGKEWLARHFQPTRSTAFPDGSVLSIAARWSTTGPGWRTSRSSSETGALAPFGYACPCTPGRS
jgi:hypothetical protein